jgi:hypothetical protein
MTRDDARTWRGPEDPVERPVEEGIGQRATVELRVGDSWEHVVVEALTLYAHRFEVRGLRRRRQRVPTGRPSPITRYARLLRAPPTLARGALRTRRVGRRSVDVAPFQLAEANVALQRVH